MTRAEIRIEAAKRRVKKAEARRSLAYKAMHDAVAAATKKCQPRASAAGRAVAESRRALTVAELAARGITPMKTVILWHPKYSGVTAQHRFVVRVTHEGWIRFVPVGETGCILKGRVARDGPYSRPTEWNDVTVTDQILKEHADA